MNQALIEASQATIFSSALFCNIWSEVYGQKCHLLGFKSDLAAVYSQVTRLGLRKYELSPHGLYWGPSKEGNDISTHFLDIVTQLCNQWNCFSLVWNFRYDAEAALKCALVRLGLSRCMVNESYTHILDLHNADYEYVLQHKVKPVTRRQIRLSGNAGIMIREIKTRSEIEQHASVYQSWAEEKKIKPKPSSLIPRLGTELNAASLFLGAFKEDKLIASILIFRDIEEWFYWYGIRDIDQDKDFATDLLLSYAIQKACQNKVRFFNMGGSNRIHSLEFFKERWGAEKRPVWSLKWTNPYWDKLLSLWKI